MLQRQLTVAVLVLVILFLIFQLAGYFADLIRILGISILLSYLLINMVDYIERYLRSRAIAIVLVYGVFALLVVVGGVVVIPAMVYQITQMLQTIFAGIPDAVQFLNNALMPLEDRLHAAQIPVKGIDLLSSLATAIPKPDTNAILSRVSDVAMSTMTWVVYGITIFIATFYFLLEGHEMSDAVIGMCPRRYRNSLHMIAYDIDRTLQSFFRGQVVLALLAGLVMLIVYLTLNVQYALLLSVFLAAWEIVPVIGPPIGFLPTLIAVGIHGTNLPVNRFFQLLIIIVIFNVMQQIKDNVVAPRYIGNVIGLHPILIFVAIMIGARLDGMLGIIFSLPVACVISVLAHHIQLKPAPHLVPRAELAQDIAEESPDLPI